MLEQGASVVVLLDYGIAEFEIRKDIHDVWDEERVTVVSPAPPLNAWSPKLAASARDLKIMLGDALLITDPTPKWLSRYVRAGAGGKLPPS